MLVPLIRIGRDQAALAVSAGRPCNIGLYATRMNTRHKQVRVHVLRLKGFAETTDCKFGGVIGALCGDADHAENGGQIDEMPPLGLCEQR